MIAFECLPLRAKYGENLALLSCTHLQSALCFKRRTKNAYVATGATKNFYVLTKIDQARCVSNGATNSFSFSTKFDRAIYVSTKLGPHSFISTI